MRTRIITAIVALAIFVPFVVYGGIPLTILISLLGVIAVGELLFMKKRLLVSFEALVSFVAVVVTILPNSFWRLLPAPTFLNPRTLIYLFIFLLLLTTVLSNNKLSFDDAGALSLGVLYIGFGFHFFLQARAENWMAFVFGLIIVWLTDSFAYIIGRKLGRHKLIPKISPNKTWEGSIGGTAVATIVAIIFAESTHFATHFSLFEIALATLILSIAGQFGDLIESALKRYFGVKDSGTLLPGHGGILDRFDSMLIVMPIIVLIGLTA
ncbi:MAG: phosphatidate cytidylyltransferase [Oenococcus sp.]|uniref:phosphatidate cytidylyltransferase n=2 Tax=Lactobacillaceae TaxID=33958 RepID=UPI0021E91C82|nr:phosphatidate cytidylyltransferase [Oenococcus kitaharae]MCV3295772.1 phosphatidate cytidylyltransferase [Oenococcus kitaharae]